jgi:hypothetical protein
LGLPLLEDSLLLALLAAKRLLIRSSREEQITRWGEVIEKTLEGDGIIMNNSLWSKDYINYYLDLRQTQKALRSFQQLW